MTPDDNFLDTDLVPGRIPEPTNACTNAVVVVTGSGELSPRMVRMIEHYRDCGLEVEVRHVDRSPDAILGELSRLIDQAHAVKVPKPAQVRAVDDRRYWKANRARHAYKGRK